MSSTEGLEILKNWQNSGATVVLTSATLKGRVGILDVRVKVQSVDELTLVLFSVDSPDENETLDLRGAKFALIGGLKRVVQLSFADGKISLLREE